MIRADDPDKLDSPRRRRKSKNSARADKELKRECEMEAVLACRDYATKQQLAT
jgi:hypothetical protein